jgi:pyridinium-3,5-bisthiocarboxylic acid mononucleotide nickel chelatase
VTRVAYLDCVGGLAGDMLLAALLDAGAPEAALRELPGRLGLEDVELRIQRVQRQGIGALHLDVLQHGRAAESGPARSWSEIRDQLGRADLDRSVHDRALRVFQRLAEAEGSIHGVPADEVHFHELGAVDTLIDVAGAVTLLAELGVQRVVCSPLPLGRGTVSSVHGALPLPAPATARLLRGAPVVGVDTDAELVTPTGGALATGLADGFGPIPAMTLLGDGFGAGTMDFAERANVVRLLLGECGSNNCDLSATIRPDRVGGRATTVVLLETNLDDLLPELIPDAAERCLEAGALDVWTAPVTMKKGRPGIIFSALARPADEDVVATAMLEHTSALVVRASTVRRHELDREFASVSVDGHEVRVKLGRLQGRLVNVAPEHDDCAAVAKATGRPVKAVWAQALAAAGELR